MRDDTMRRRRILLLSDSLQGGAAQIPNLLADDLSAHEDCEVMRWHFSPPAAQGFFQPAVRELSLSPQRRRPPLERLMKNISRKAAALMRRARHERALLEAVRQQQPDLIHVHNIHAADIDHATLQKLPAHIPIVWTLHDFWPVRGVAFNWSEPGCAALQRCTAGATARRTLLQRRDAFFSRRGRLALVAPSAYVQRVARHFSARHRLPCAFIPHVVDRGFLYQNDRAAAAHHWGLSPDRLWIGAGSTWNNSRKGMDVLWRALAQTDCRHLGLLLWGHEPRHLPQAGEFQVRSIGHVSGTSTLASLYAAADVFVCPTKADTGPLTVMESMAAGTPVVASRVGGIPERVSHGTNGLLFPSKDHEALAVLLAEIRSGAWQLPEMGAAARSFALQHFNPELQVPAHLQLYDRLLNDA